MHGFRRKDGFIYFFRAGAEGPIKIGFSCSPRLRIESLQTGNYEKLFFLGNVPGTKKQEKAIHKSLMSSHIRGEWFHPTEEVMTLVNRMLLESPPTSDASWAIRSAPPAPIPVMQEHEYRAVEDILLDDRAKIEQAMANAGGDITKTAILLGCCRRTLQKRMRKLGLPPGKSGRPMRLIGFGNGQ